MLDTKHIKQQLFHKRLVRTYMNFICNLLDIFLFLFRRIPCRIYVNRFAEQEEQSSCNAKIKILHTKRHTPISQKDKQQTVIDIMSYSIKVLEIQWPLYFSIGNFFMIAC